MLDCGAVHLDCGQFVRRAVTYVLGWLHAVPAIFRRTHRRDHVGGVLWRHRRDCGWHPVHASARTEPALCHVRCAIGLRGWKPAYAADVRPSARPALDTGAVRAEFRDVVPCRGDRHYRARQSAAVGGHVLWRPFHHRRPVAAADAFGLRALGLRPHVPFDRRSFGRLGGAVCVLPTPRRQS